MKCKKQNCNGTMRPGKAVQETLVGRLLDFPGDTYPVTLSTGGAGKLIDCLKCDECGYSITRSKEEKND